MSDSIHTYDEPMQVASNETTATLAPDSMSWQVLRAFAIALICGVLWIAGMQIQKGGRTQVEGFVISVIGSAGLLAQVLIRAKLQTRFLIENGKFENRDPNRSIPLSWTPWDLVWASPALLVFPCSVASWVTRGKGLVEGLFLGLFVGALLVMAGIARQIVIFALNGIGSVYLVLADIVVFCTSYLSVAGSISSLGI